MITENQVDILREQNGIFVDPSFPKGEGMNRVAYRAWKLNTDTGRTTYLTVCVPKKDSADSVQNRINSVKRDREEQEAKILGQIRAHSNLVELDSSYRIEGATINILKEADGLNLEERVKTLGRIKDQKTADIIIYQSLLGLEDLHKQGYLHRDIKPSNLVVDDFKLKVALKNHSRIPENAAKLIDFQYAMPRAEVQELTMPTRGCSEYATRNLLNALVTGIPAKSDEKSDLYALGGTFYYMLTGEDPGDYKIVQDENGKEIEIDGQKTKIGLVRKSKNGKILEKLELIEDIKDEKRIKKLTHKLPGAYREFVYRCMTSENNGFKNVTNAREYFEKLKLNFGRNLSYSAKTTAKRTLAVAWPMLLISALIPTMGYLTGSPSADSNQRNLVQEQVEYREMMRTFYGPAKTPHEIYLLINKNNPMSGEDAE